MVRNPAPSRQAPRKRPKPQKARPPRAKPIRWQQLAGQALSEGASAGVMALRNRLGLNTEAKVFDVAASVPMGTATWLPLLTPPVIAQGLTNGTRIGASLRVSRFQVRWHLLPFGLPAGVNDFGMLRIVGTWDPNPQQTLLTAAQIFATPAGLNSLNTPYVSTLDSTGATVVYDKVFDYSLGGSNPMPHDSVQIVADDMHMVWTSSDTLGLNANLQAGALQWWYCYNSSSGIATPTLNFLESVEFVDN